MRNPQALPTDARVCKKPAVNELVVHKKRKKLVVNELPPRGQDAGTKNAGYARTNALLPLLEEQPTRLIRS